MLLGKIVIWLMAYLLMSQSDLLFPQMWVKIITWLSFKVGSLHHLFYREIILPITILQFNCIPSFIPEQAEEITVKSYF